MTAFPHTYNFQIENSSKRTMQFSLIFVTLLTFSGNKIQSRCSRAALRKDNRNFFAFRWEFLCISVGISLHFGGNFFVFGGNFFVFWWEFFFAFWWEFLCILVGISLHFGGNLFAFWWEFLCIWWVFLSILVGISFYFGGNFIAFWWEFPAIFWLT